MIEALDIHVKGIVQGVGFRPFVYRMAKKYLIKGWVLNAADGVYIHAEGESKLLDEFVMELSDNAPAAAQVSEIELKEVPLEDFDDFEIRFSDDAAVQETTLVSPDLAICADCEAELFNPNDRRYRYPFINCTNCGPRFTIIDRLPYDRANTSMAAFPMCERCASEYADPLDRRFHAQPDACFECGPHISYTSDAGKTVSQGLDRETSDALFEAAVSALAEGKILAVKGLGGFHLVCDAANREALQALRERKRRQGKPFAVMAADVEDVRRMCEVSPEEEAVLTSPSRPIVLLKKRRDVAFAPGLADGLGELGVMLPYTPVQKILMHDFAEAMRTHLSADEGPWAANPPLLVMTSGNIHDEPIVISDEEAYVKLSAVADAFLGNDRPIRTRFDDSVVRMIDAGSAGPALQVIRRARGYAPRPLRLPAITAGLQADAAPAPAAGSDIAAGDHATGADAEPMSPVEAAQSGADVIFATGPEQKNTFTLLRGDEAFVSQHIGDMEDADTYDVWLETKTKFEGLFQMKPDMIACDLHPEYLTTKWALEQDIPLVQVQHHQAHVVSVMAEHGITDAVCGVAFDGTGYGPDGAIWGGEFLICNTADFERFANFVYMPMPGGAAAIKHPLRMAYGALYTYDLLEHPAAVRALAGLGESLDVCRHMVETGFNTPMTSSVGRLFDAVSALLGICTEPAYEGEGAVLLEAAMDAYGAEEPGAAAREAEAGEPYDHGHGIEDEDAVCHEDREDELLAKERYAIGVVKNTATQESTAQDTSVLLFDAETTLKALLDDMEAGVPTAVIARRFHDAVVSAVCMGAELVRAMYDISTVALSGGCFMNRYLITHAIEGLENAGFTVAINRDIPPNDGCISVGQAMVAWAKTNR